MLKKTYINIEGNSYIAELQEDPIYSENLLHAGRIFTILDKKGNTIGCLTLCLTKPLKSIWVNENLINKDIEELLFLRILPHINLESTLDDMRSIYSNCIQIYIDSTERTYDPDKKIQTLKSYSNPQELVNELVFGGEVDEIQLQNDVLSNLYEVHLNNPDEYSRVDNLCKELFIDEKLMQRCLRYLRHDGNIEINGTVDSGEFAFVRITIPGAKYVRNNFKQIYSGMEVIIMGDYVGKDKTTTIINGDNNLTNVKSSISNSFNAQVITKVDELKDAVEKFYEAADKTEILEQLETIKALSEKKENFPKIREIIGKVISKTAEVATVGAFALELMKIFT